MENDTINLLDECNAGIKMGVSSIDDVLPQVKNHTMRSLLQRSKNEHVRLGDETHALLNELGESGKRPNPMAKSMSRVKTNVKMAVEPGDKTIADLMTDGCNMGVKSLSRYLNEYSGAAPRAQEIAKRLINLESNLAEDMRVYL